MPVRRAKQPPAADPESPVVLHKNLTVLTTTDPLLLREIKADKKIGPLLIAELSETTVILAPGSEDAVTRQLLKSGHLPQIRKGP